VPAFRFAHHRLLALLVAGSVCLSTRAAGQITPDALRSHVSFLASDVLEGRDTPSRGLNVAAEYIAAQFRGAGLKLQSQKSEFELLLNGTPIPKEAVVEAPKFVGTASVAKVQEHEGAITATTRGGATLSFKGEKVSEKDLITFVPPGLKNVIGVLPGRSKEYVLLTAHYDHVGMEADAAGGTDNISNGANDNASSIAALIETARALKGRKPLRSIVFIAYFGEEKGLVGSRYYARHPVFPIKDTVAQLNLEQLGRTDDLEGPRVAAATLTGYDRSNMGAILRAAAAPLQVRIYKHPKFSEAFFARSDNEALAKLGVPAHTMSVAYGFPDYHKASDEWDKLDYDNMARITRAISAGVWRLANRTQRPILSAVPPAASAPKSENSPASPKPQQSKPSPGLQPKPE
jgi:Zn-dependent M28 family amino/carboxypeptidase